MTTPWPAPQPLRNRETRVYETTENRAMKAGYRRGTARDVRDERTSAVRDDQARRYAERYRNTP